MRRSYETTLPRRLPSVQSSARLLLKTKTSSVWIASSSYPFLRAQEKGNFRIRMMLGFDVMDLIIRDSWKCNIYTLKNMPTPIMNTGMLQFRQSWSLCFRKENTWQKLNGGQWEFNNLVVGSIIWFLSKHTAKCAFDLVIFPRNRKAPNVIPFRRLLH